MSKLPALRRIAGGKATITAALAGALASCTLLSLTSSPAQAVASAATSTTQTTTSSSPTRLMWLDDQESPTHNYTATEAVTQAKRFSIISALTSTYSSYVSAMKTANPSLRLLAYMNGTFATGAEATGLPESWFLHDRYGHRLMNSWKLYLMNPGNSGWVSNRVTKCSHLIAISHYDGCFVDNLGTGTFGQLSATPIDPSTGYPYTAKNWLSRTASLAGTIRTQTNRFTFGNGLSTGQAYFDPTAPSSVISTTTNGALAEAFIRLAKSGITSFRSLTAWKQDVNMVAQAAANGKRFAAITKVWVSGTQTQIANWHAFAVGSFLLAENGLQTFEFSASPKTDISAGDSLLAKLGGLGSPAAGYSSLNGVYRRPFSGGLVAVNPTGSSLTISLPKTYKDALSGASVSGSLTLAGHTARFLLG